MVCLIFHTAIIINRKNWRRTRKLHFEELSIFFLKANAYICQDPSPPVCFCLLFNDPPPPPQRTYFLNDPVPALLTLNLLATSPDPLTPSPALFTPLPASIFPNKLAPYVPRNPPFCSFVSFPSVWVMPFFNRPESSKDLTIFIISAIRSFKIISAVVQTLRFFMYSCVCCWCFCC